MAALVGGGGCGSPSAPASSSPKQPALADALALIRSKPFIALTHAFGPGIPHWPGLLLAHLDQVPEAGAMVVVAFPKPKAGSGFPARVLAILP